MLLIVVAALLVIAFILNIIGLNKAKPDEENFKYALYAVIVGVIVSIVQGAAKNSEFIQNLGQTIGRICSFLSTYYVCTALVRLADRLGNGEMSGLGLRTRKLLMTVWLLGIALGVVGMIFDQIGVSVAFAVIGGIAALAGSVLDIVVYVLYLKLLSRARTMLEA